MPRTDATLSENLYTQEFLVVTDRGPVMKLDVSNQKQFLSIDKGEFSDLAGIDVTQPWRRLDPRRPIDGTERLIHTDQPVVESVIPSDFRGQGVWSFHGRDGTTNHGIKVTTVTNIVVGDQYASAQSPAFQFPAFLPGTSTVTIFKRNAVDETYEVTVHRITGLTDDGKKITFEPALAEIPDATHDIEFTILSVQTYDRRGLWITNGKKFFLFQNSVYLAGAFMNNQLVDKGAEWRGARISGNRFMFVSDRGAPRVVTLVGDRAESPIVCGINATLDSSGLVITLVSAFIDYVFADGDTVEITVAGAGAVLGVYEIVSRTNSAITLRTSAGTTSTTDFSFCVNRRKNDPISLAGPMPPFGGTDPQTGPIESTQDVVEDHPRFSISGGGGSVTAGTTAVKIRVVDLATGAVSAFTQVSESQGGLTKTVSENDRVSLTLNTSPVGSGKFAGIADRIHVVQVYRQLSAGTDYHLETEMPYGKAKEPGFLMHLTLSDADLGNKPILLSNDVLKGPPPAGRDIAVLGDTRTVLIAGKTDIDNFTNPSINGIEFRWPTIDNDNVIHFSRPDAFEPENFPPALTNQIQISKTGDRFQRFVASGDEVLAVMEQGVYRFLSGGRIGVQRRVIAETGLGTPWPKSVIAIEKLALWITPNNIYTYDAEAINFDQNPLRAIGYQYRNWLREAFDLGDEIQSFYDPQRRVIVIRRIKVDGAFQDIEHSLDTGNSTFVDDRVGLTMAASVNVRNDEGAARLYAIDQSGAVFEIGRELRVGDSHPYDGKDASFTLDVSYTTTDEQIAKNGAFSKHMLGDSIRVTSTVAARDGQVRKIVERRNAGSVVEHHSSGNADFNIAVMLKDDTGMIAYRNVTNTRFEIAKMGIDSTGAPTIDTKFVGAKDPLGIGLIALEGNRFVLVHSTTAAKPDINLYEFNGVVIKELDNKTLTSPTASAAEPTLALLSSRHVLIGVLDTGFKVANASMVGNTMSINSDLVTIETSAVSPIKLLTMSDGVVVAAYREATSGNCRVLKISGSGPTFVQGAESTFVATGAAEIALDRIDDNNFIISYTDGSACSVRVGTLDAADPPNITYGTSVQLFPAAATDFAISVVSPVKAIAVYRQTSSSILEARGIEISGTTLVADVSAPNIATNGQFPALMDLGTQEHQMVAYRDDNDSGHGTILPISIRGTSSVSTGVLIGGTADQLIFDKPIIGLAEPDKIDIGAVPFRVRFAPILGDRVRNLKQLDGVSVWAQPNGKTVTTPKTMTVKAFIDLSDVAAQLDIDGKTSLTVPIKAPTEVDTLDEELYVTLDVEGKAIELELSNNDANLGISLVNVAGVVRDKGELEGDRSATG